MKNNVVVWFDDCFWVGKR